jgi:hypothetical protein
MDSIFSWSNCVSVDCHWIYDMGYEENKMSNLTDDWETLSLPMLAVSVLAFVLAVLVFVVVR